MSYRGSIERSRIKNNISSVHKGHSTDVNLLKAKSARSEAKLFHKLHEDDYASGKNQHDEKERELLNRSRLDEQHSRLVRVLKGLALVTVAGVAIVSTLRRRSGRLGLSWAIRAAAKVDPRHLLSPEIMKSSELKAKLVAKRVALAVRRARVH